MSHQVLARKWRPHTFQDMIGQEPILRMLKNALDNQRLHHAYLFTGTRGVGKTTLARILAKCLNCESGVTSTPCGMCQTCTAIDAGRFLDLIEVDAASRTKVEDTRELLDNVQYQPTQGRYKIYLIDEVHMLSGHSFNALLKTLEEPPPHVKFLLATTDPKRLPVTVLSRCLQFNLKRVPVQQITQHLEHICTAEKIAFEHPALLLLAEAADGSLRDALSLLDQAIAFCGQKITIADTRQMLGSVDQEIVFRLLHALADQDGKKLLNEITSFAEHAPNFNQAVEDLLSLLHQITIKQILPDASESHTHISELATRFTAEDIQLYYQIALIGRRDLALTPNPQYGFEMILLRMLAFKPVLATTPPPSKSIAVPVKTIEEKKTDNNWATLLPQLKLSGLAYALASNCTLEKITDNKVILSLAAHHEPMFNKKLEERIEQALTQHFNKPMKLDIQITSATLDTPAKHQQQEKTAQLSNAADAIKNDDHVQKIMGIFNATLDVDSIKAIDPAE
ncbi:MAG TPA: DNA polymerase III subunit gamma/tau [Gammaproteobacteria bacterium]|nr:DNA polymerase III subunit gamma/tau [Gammaproteobacteria bacterium]